LLPAKTANSVIEAKDQDDASPKFVPAKDNHEFGNSTDYFSENNGLHTDFRGKDQSRNRVITPYTAGEYFFDPASSYSFSLLVSLNLTNFSCWHHSI